MTQVICLTGGPGRGKSTAAAHLYSTLSRHQLSVALVTEAAKDYAWRKQDIDSKEQFRITSEQIYREMLIYDQVDYIVTDSPIYLGKVYEKFYNKGGLVTDLVDTFLGYHYAAYTYYELPKLSSYKTDGRFEDEEASDKIHSFAMELLTDDGEEIFPYDHNEIVKQLIPKPKARLWNGDS